MGNFIGEEWKVVPEFREHYLVSNFGRVKSIEREASAFGDGRTRVVRERILKPRIQSDGRVMYHLQKPGKAKTWQAHILVMTCFVCEKPGPGWMICHKDRDVSNNKRDNLKWVPSQKRMREIQDAFTLNS